MARLNTKVKLYLEANSKTWEEEQNNIILQNDSDGKGDYIASWNVSGLNKPTDEQLDSYNSNGDTLENLNKILIKRARTYPSVQEQLDKLYHDMNSDKGDKTGEWFKSIKAVKDANPKE